MFILLLPILASSVLICEEFPILFNFDNCIDPSDRRQPTPLCGPNEGTWDCPPSFDCVDNDSDGFGKYCESGETENGDCCIHENIRYIDFWFRNVGILSVWKFNILNFDIQGFADGDIRFNGTTYENIYLVPTASLTFMSLVFDYEEHDCNTTVYLYINGSYMFDHNFAVNFDTSQFSSNLIFEMTTWGDNQIYFLSAHNIEPTPERIMELYALGSERGVEETICYNITAEECDECLGDLANKTTLYEECQEQLENKTLCCDECCTNWYNCEEALSECNNTKNECCQGWDQCNETAIECCNGWDECNNTLIECQRNLTECEENLIECNETATECQRNLTECEENLIECNETATICQGNLTECEENLIECNETATICQGNLTECEENLIECNETATECQGNLTECEEISIELQTNLTSCSNETQLLMEQLGSAQTTANNWMIAFIVTASILGLILCCGVFLLISALLRRWAPIEKKEEFASNFELKDFGPNIFFG